MPGSLSDFAETTMLDHLFNQVNYTTPPSVWLGFSEGNPGDDGLGINEPVGNGYARSQITFGAPAARLITNSVAVNFPQATGDWQTTDLDYYMVYSQQSGGDFLAHGPLANAIQVVNGNTPTVAIGEIDIEFLDLATKGGNNNLSTFFAEAVLEHLFRSVALTTPSTYLGYATAELNDDTTGTNVVEPSGGNYSRLLVNNNAGISPKWRLAQNNVVRNQDSLVMPTPTASWGTVVASFVANAATLGQIMYYDNQITDQLINIDDTVRIAVDQFSAYLS